MTATEGHEANRGLARFQIVERRDGRYAWQLLNPHATPTAQSMETYDTKDAAIAAAEEARWLIGGAPIERL
jgi:uncharacterized protein YegP (UPF0339 family)